MPSDYGLTPEASPGYAPAERVEVVVLVGIGLSAVRPGAAQAASWMLIPGLAARRALPSPSPLS